MNTDPKNKLKIKNNSKKSSLCSMKIFSADSKKQTNFNNIKSNKNLIISEKIQKLNSSIKKTPNKSKLKIKLKLPKNNKNNFNNIFSTKTVNTVSNEKAINYLKIKKNLPIKLKENHNLQTSSDEDISKNNTKYTPSSNFIKYFRDLFSNKAIKSKRNFSKTKSNFWRNNGKQLNTISNNNNLEYLRDLFQLDNVNFDHKKNNEKIFYASDGFKQNSLPKIKSIESKNARSRNYSLCLKKKNMLQKSPLNQNIVFSSNLELNNHLIRQFNFSNDEVHSLRNLKTSERTLNKIKETRNKQIHNNEETTKKKHLNIIYEDSDVKNALDNYYEKKKITKIKNGNEVFDGIKEIGSGFIAKEKEDKFSLVKFNELYKVIQLHELKKKHEISGSNLNNTIAKNVSKFFEDQTKKLYSTRNMKIPLKCLKRHLRQDTVNKYLRISGTFFGLPC